MTKAANGSPDTKRVQYAMRVEELDVSNQEADIDDEEDEDEHEFREEERLLQQAVRRLSVADASFNLERELNVLQRQLETEELYALGRR